MAFKSAVACDIDVSDMNANALRLADPLLTKLIDHAAHVVLYSFKPDSQEWEKVNIEGALFVYSRKGEPRYNLIILNRLSTLNFLESLDDGLSLQVKGPFLLYRNSKGKIYGIWFHNLEECTKIAKSIEASMKEIDLCKPRNPDIGTALTPPSSRINNSSNETKSGTTPKRVLDFFALASNNTPSQPPGGFNQVTALRPKPEITESRKSLNEGSPFLNRLLSKKPVKTLEQIEKQQKRTTPIKGNGVAESSIPNAKVVVPTKIFGYTESGKNSNFRLTNGFGLIRSPEPTAFPQCERFNPICGSPEEDEAVNNQPSSSGLETPSKLALITPNMFTSVSKSSESEDDKTEMQPEPLTKAQLLQAVNYLLKHDADFIVKLHEAYVKSFVERVS